MNPVAPSHTGTAPGGATPPTRGTADVGRPSDSVGSQEAESDPNVDAARGVETSANSSTSGYRVNIPVYEGPFDLLLHLILRDEVDLWEVQLSSIIDSYLAEMERLERLDLEIATEFLLIAATLVDLKAKRLLPGRNHLDLDEELARFEVRDLLLARLLDCKTFQDAAGCISDRLDAGRGRWPRTLGVEEPFASMAPDPLERITPLDLRAAAERALAPRAEPELRTDHLEPVRATVRDAIETVLTMLPAVGTVSFVELARGARHRVEVVVRFLAVLELCKQGAVELEQVGTLTELMVSTAGRHGVDFDSAALEWDDDTIEAKDDTEHDTEPNATPMRTSLRSTSVSKCPMST